MTGVQTCALPIYQINLAVEIKQKRRGGEICIKFSQFDELDSLFKRLGIE